MDPSTACHLQLGQCPSLEFSKENLTRKRGPVNKVEKGLDPAPVDVEQILEGLL